MITREQVEQAKITWSKARLSALYAHKSLAQLKQLIKALIVIYRRLGFQVSDISQCFKIMMKTYTDNYKAALTHMDNMSVEYEILLEAFKKS
jgi:hypothetical protein